LIKEGRDQDGKEGSRREGEGEIREMGGRQGDGWADEPTL